MVVMVMIFVIIFDDKVEEVLLAQQDEQNGFGEKLNAEARVEVAFNFFELRNNLKKGGENLKKLRQH